MDIFNAFDFSILDFIYQSIRCAFLDPIMWALSMFANKGIGWLALGVILLIPKKTRPAALAGILAIGLGFAIGELGIKHFVCRVRPYDQYEQFHNAVMPFTLNAGTEHSFSFPSGHTSCSFAAAVCAFKINKKCGIITLIVAALIGFSRLYNYVHFPTDVIAGAILGTLCGLLMVFIFRKFSLDDKLRRIGRKH